MNKLYYSARQEYESIFESRYNSDDAIHIDFPALASQCFCMQNREISDLLLRIYHANWEIERLVNSLPGIAISQFTKRCLIDEIVLTNDIEGVNSTRKDISKVLNELSEKNRRQRFYGLIQKYEMLQTPNSFQTCEDIRNIYNELVLDEVVSEDPTEEPDGLLFRAGPVSIVSPAQKEIHRGLSPESAIIQAMEKALNFANSDICDPLIRTAAFHYMFGYIHPFYNGNGRLARYLSSCMLAKTLHPLMGYRLSYTIKENISKYYKAFKECNDPHSHGDLTTFVYTFLSFLLAAAEQLLDALQVRLNKLNHYGYLLSLHIEDKEIYSLGHVLIQAQLFSEDGITATDYMLNTNHSRTTFNKRLEFFRQKNILIVKKIGKEFHYKMDLQALESLSQ